jgi:hypothetical protein
MKVKDKGWISLIHEQILTKKENKGKSMKKIWVNFVKDINCQFIKRHMEMTNL